MDYLAKEDIIEYIFDKIKYLTLPSESNNYKSRFLESNILLYCVILLLTLKLITVFISINFSQNIFFADITKTALENFANQTRQSLGLQPLTENSKLNQAAQLKAENMVLNNYFAHTSPTGITPWYWFTKAGYNYKYAGENLAIGFYESEEVFKAWLSSSSHKANILNPNYKEIGTAVLRGFGENNAIVVVQEFASPQPIKQAPAKKNTVEQPAKQQKPETAVKPTEQIADTSDKEKVLSQSIESNTVIEVAKPGSSNLYFKIMNSILYDYDELLQSIVYGVSLIVIGVLFAVMFFNINSIIGKKLVFRSILIVILLSLAALISRETIIALIPHQMVI